MGKKSGGRVRVKQMGPKSMPPNPMEALVPPEEMIKLPPKNDSSMTQIWPLSETFSMDYKHFHAIYPTYLDANKTIKLGRRIAAKDAVPDPSVYEISEALQSLNIRHAIQPYKGYSRDTESRWFNPGRVLVDLDAASSIVGMSADGSFDVDAMPNVGGSDDDSGDGGENSEVARNKKALMKEIAKRVPHLASRAKRLEENKKAEEAEKKKKEEALAAKGTSTKSSGGGTSSKKKGKKKR